MICATSNGVFKGILSIYGFTFNGTTIMTDPKDFLYISDLDGTLLTPESNLPDHAIDRLNRLIDKGLKFTIATARNYNSAYSLLRSLNLKIPVILFNGVYLTEFSTGRNIILSNFIPNQVATELISVAGPLGIDPFVYAYDQTHRVYFRNIANPGSRNYINEQRDDNRLQYVPHYNFVTSESIPGILFIDTHPVLEPLYVEIKRRYPSDLNLYFAEDIAVPGYCWLQIFHQQANKGSMVEQLASHMNMPLDHTVVFGDYLNDLEMFRVAGKAVAMGNALPQVKEAADIVIGNNNTFAVIDYLESLGFN